MGIGCVLSAGKNLVTKENTFAEFDNHVRQAVYDRFAQSGCAPKTSELAALLDVPAGEITAACQRLAEAQILVLQEDGEILMAVPFSAVETPFKVETAEQTYWANCMWDALGIAAAIDQDSQIGTACPDCDTPLTLYIKDGQVSGDAGIVHFLVPANDWWKNIIFT